MIQTTLKQDIFENGTGCIAFNRGEKVVVFDTNGIKFVYFGDGTRYEFDDEPESIRLFRELFQWDINGNS